MRLWFINHYALPPGASGGPTRHLGLARALRDLGHDITVHASVFDHYSRTDHRERGRDGHVIEQVEGITYVWWSTPPYGSAPARIRNMTSFARRVGARALRIGLPSPDVVVGSSPHLLAGLAARRVARRARVPFIFEVRDLWPQTFVDMGEIGPHHPVTLALRLVERSLYRTADELVTVLPAAVPYFLDHGADPAHLTAIPNGAALGPMPQSTEPREDGPIEVVYAGTIGHANGLELAVDAAAELHRRGRRDIRVRLVGAGPERDGLLARAAASPGAPVVIDPPVPSAEVPAVLAAADICLLVLRPSPVFRWGVSPTKLFDYLAAGRPVVAAVSAPDTIIGPAGAGLWIEPGNAGALADALESMADQTPEERQTMGESGRRYAELHHGFDTLAADLMTVVERATATEKAGRS